MTPDLLERGNLALDCSKLVGKLIRGGGGGRPDLATAGGKDPEKLPEALHVAAEFYRSSLLAHPAKKNQKAN